MNNLPKETFIPIISYLSTSDKIECILVCKAWYELITRTNLYEHLEFKCPKKLDQALVSIQENKYIGNRVMELSVKDLDLDITTVLAMPEYFSNVKYLKWTENYYGVKSNIYPSKSEYAPALQYWKYVERIQDIPRYFWISIYLLESCELHYLKHLDISFRNRTNLGGGGGVRTHRPHLKALLNNLHNAPALTHITFRYTVLDLNDMEKLHAAVPKLKELKLETVGLSGEGEVTVSNVATQLESFSICIAAIEWNYVHIGFTQLIAKWLYYISQKYRNVRQLKVLRWWIDNKPLVTPHILEEPVITVLSNLPNVTSYEIEVFPNITRRILQVLDENRRKLQHVHVWIQKEETMQQDLQLLPCYKSTQNIYTLSLSQIGKMDGSILSPALINSSCRLLNLVNLSITNFFGVSTVALLIDILHNLNMLETLMFHKAQFYSDSSNIAVPVIANKCRIKSLDIRTFSYAGGDLFYINRLFDFVLRSCPLLQNFNLCGGLPREPVAFVLDFLNNTKLQSITIDMGGCHYYTFDHIPSKQGKRWKNYDQLFEGSSRDEDSYHISFAWQGRVKLKLMDSGSNYYK